MPHNVSVVRRESGKEVFNVGTEPHQNYLHTFDRVGEFDVTCDIHEGMEATVIVARGPMTTIAGDDGRFSLPGVAFGSYTLSLTYSGQTVEQAVEVSGARTEVKLPALGAYFLHPTTDANDQAPSPSGRLFSSLRLPQIRPRTAPAGADIAELWQNPRICSSVISSTAHMVPKGRAERHLPPGVQDDGHQPGTT
jgi:hypothetical protein